MIKEFLIEYLPEKKVCECGDKAVYSVWSWIAIHKDYVPIRAVCRKCGDDLSRKIQEGGLIDQERELTELVKCHTK